MAYHMEEPDYKLEVRQQPVYARVAIGKEKGMCPEIASRMSPMADQVIQTASR